MTSKAKASDKATVSLAQEIFLRRMAAAEVPRGRMAGSRLADAEAIFALTAASAFVHASRGWLDEESDARGQDG